jgi:hypothetical protein
LSRIEEQAFAFTGLVDIVIPASVSVLGLGCFLQCSSLSTVSFESNSNLSRIEDRAFEEKVNIL